MKQINYVILVDEQDKILGSMEKLEAHEKALLHRAFSGFVFNGQKELLLQQRDINKYHNGGVWSNTVCSHPYPNETTKHGIKRRIFEEFGFHINNFKEIGKFHYISSFKNGLTENELDHIFVAKYNGEKINPNKKEIMDYIWITKAELQKNIETNPNNYSFWLKEILKLKFLDKYF